MRPRMGFYHISVKVFLIAVFLLQSNSVFAATWAKKPEWAKGYPSSPNQNVRRNPYKQEIEMMAPYAPGSNNLAIDIGQVFLMGQLSDSYDDNLGFQIHYTYGVSDIFGFDASIGRSTHTNGDFSMTALKTGLRMNLSWFDKIIPYAVFGLGFYRPSVVVYDGPSKVDELSPVLFGIHIGPGIDLQLTDRLFFGAAITFHDIFGAKKEAANGALVDVGGTFTSFLLHTGMSF